MIQQNDFAAKWNFVGSHRHCIDRGGDLSIDTMAVTRRKFSQAFQACEILSQVAAIVLIDGSPPRWIQWLQLIFVDYRFIY